jgi:transposase-like protein
VNYSEEFKKEVVETLASGAGSLVEASKAFGLNRGTIYRWLTEAGVVKRPPRNGKRPSHLKSSPVSRPAAPLGDEQEVLEELETKLEAVTEKITSLEEERARISQVLEVCYRNKKHLNVACLSIKRIEE